MLGCMLVLAVSGLIPRPSASLAAQDVADGVLVGILPSSGPPTTLPALALGVVMLCATAA